MSSVVPYFAPLPYLHLLKRCLTRTLYVDEPTDAEIAGLIWPSEAETMIGYARLDNIVDIVWSVLNDGVPGDLLEAGVWRGGAAIMMKAALDSYAPIDNRIVWLADSFNGLPPPDPAYPADVDDPHHTFAELRVSADEVRRNFNRYGLLDHRVRLLEGLFADTLPGPVAQLAVLRCDGDMYGSTWETLVHLEPLVSRGGFVIIDDYYLLKGCRQATDDYRDRELITAPIVQIDQCGAWWRKGA